VFVVLVLLRLRLCRRHALFLSPNAHPPESRKLAKTHTRRAANDKQFSIFGELVGS